MQRRTLLKSVAAGSVAFTAAVGSAQQAMTATLQPHRRQVKIARVEAFNLPSSTFVCVTADDGTTGWGEAGHDGGPITVKMITDEMARLAVGTDVFDAEPLWSKIYYETDEMGPGGIASQALAGIDCALWDLRGKLLGQPVWALLGGKYRSQFPLYGSFGIGQYGDGNQMTPREAAAKTEELLGEGFRAIKVRLGIREENADPDPDPAFPIVAAVRAAMGPDLPLYVDANNGYRVARAIEVGRRLAGDYNVSVFEEPVAAYHYASLGRVSDAANGLMIACGEHEFTPYAFRDLILHGRVHLLNPDVSKLSGITGGRKVAALAEAFDLPISVHNARPTLLTAAHAHYVAACQTATRIQEHPGNRRLEELWPFFHNRIGQEDGILVVPDTPGLGLEVNERAVRAAQ